MTALALTVVCSFFVNVTGTGVLEARYEHEWPPGQHYTYTDSVVLKPGDATINAEGWPYLVRVRYNGQTVGQCSYGDVIFQDGFDSGDTGSWR
jgi:hypothetical protein